MKEIVEMTQILLEMQTDTYMMCKYTMQAVSRDSQQMEAFVNKLFSLIDSRRPLLIGMKEAICR